MSSLKAIKAHAVSVGNIQKITNTIKMVATSKFMVAEKDLRKIKIFGQGTRMFYKVSKISYDPRKGVYAVVTGDRGLCGGLHTKICKSVKLDQKTHPAEGGIVCLGEKAKFLLAMDLKKQFRLVINGVGHSKPTFKQAATISNRIFAGSSIAMLSYPYYHNIMHCTVAKDPLITSAFVINSKALYRYELDEDDLEFYFQFSTASMIFYALNEAFVSETANRITSMTAASRNASKVKKRLMLTYNTVRQEKITNEIIDIVSGMKTTNVSRKKKSERILNYLLDESSSAIPEGEIPQFEFEIEPVKELSSEKTSENKPSAEESKKESVSDKENETMSDKESISNKDNEKDKKEKPPCDPEPEF